MSREVLREHFAPDAARAEQVLRDVAERPGAAGLGGHVVNDAQHLFGGVEGCRAEAADLHRRDVGEVVSHERHVRERDVERGGEVGDDVELVALTQPHERVLDAELSRSPPGDVGVAPADDRRCDVGGPQELHPDPVARMELLHLAAFRQERDPSIRERAVHVHDEEERQ